MKTINIILIFSLSCIMSVSCIGKKSDGKVVSNEVE